VKSVQFPGNKVATSAGLVEPIWVGAPAPEAVSAVTETLFADTSRFVFVTRNTAVTVWPTDAGFGSSDTHAAVSVGLSDTTCTALLVPVTDCHTTPLLTLGAWPNSSNPAIGVATFFKVGFLYDGKNQVFTSYLNGIPQDGQLGPDQRIKGTSVTGASWPNVRKT